MEKFSTIGVNNLVLAQSAYSLDLHHTKGQHDEILHWPQLHISLK